MCAGGPRGPRWSGEGAAGSRSANRPRATRGPRRCRPGARRARRDGCGLRGPGRRALGGPPRKTVPRGRTPHAPWPGRPVRRTPGVRREIPPGHEPTPPVPRRCYRRPSRRARGGNPPPPRPAAAPKAGPGGSWPRHSGPGRTPAWPGPARPGIGRPPPPDTPPRPSRRPGRPTSTRTTAVACPPPRRSRFSIPTTPGGIRW